MTWQGETSKASSALLWPILNHPGVRRRGPEGSPNVLFIVLDDVGYGHLALVTERRSETPNIDRLAGAGLRSQTIFTPPHCARPPRSLPADRPQPSYQRLGDDIRAVPRFSPATTG